MVSGSKSDAYANAGVDITAGYKAVELMKKHIAKTMTPGVVSDIGGFGGMFELDVKNISKKTAYVFKDSKLYSGPTDIVYKFATSN